MIAIAAMDETGGIGKNGTLPWDKDKKDLELFRLVTHGSTVIMGRKTWADPKMPRPLKNRLNVVVTSYVPDKVQYEIDGTVFVPTFNAELFKQYYKNPILIGGATLFNQAIRERSIDQFIINFKKGDYDCDTRVHYGILYQTHVAEQVSLHGVDVTIFSRRD